MQGKLNDHVYSFFLFVSSIPDYQAEFYSIKSGPLYSSNNNKRLY